MFVFVAAAITMLVAVAAFAVDLGMQRVARRDMQALADVVALDLGRLVDGRQASEILEGQDAGKPGLDAARAASVARNSTSPLGDAPVVTAVLVDLDVHGDPVRENGAVKVLTGSEEPDAVLVEARTSVDFAFATGAGGVSRSALANSTSVACFRLGSYAASVRSGDGALLDDMLGDALGVTTVGYQGLVDAEVTLGALASELDLLTPDQVVAAEVSLFELVEAAAAALAHEDSTAEAELAILDELAAALVSRTELTVVLGELFELGSASSQALATGLNVLDLLGAAAFAADGDQAVRTGIFWNLPALSNAEITADIVEVPRLACGEAGLATARTGQLKLSTTIQYSRGSKLAGLDFVGDPNVTVNVDVATATGLLTAVDCGVPDVSDPEGMTVQVARSNPTLSLAVPVHLHGEVGTEQLSTSLETLLGELGYTVTQIVNLLLNLNKIKIELDLTMNIGASAPPSASTHSVTFEHPEMAYGEPVPVPGRMPVAIPHVVFDETEISGTANLVVNGTAHPIDLGDVDLGFVVDAVRSPMLTDTINPLIDKVNSVIEPVSELLGLSLTGADLFALPRPACDAPQLRG